MRVISRTYVIKFFQSVHLRGNIVCYILNYLLYLSLQIRPQLVHINTDYVVPRKFNNIYV